MEYPRGLALNSAHEILVCDSMNDRVVVRSTFCAFYVVLRAFCVFCIVLYRFVLFVCFCCLFVLFCVVLRCFVCFCVDFHVVCVVLCVFALFCVVLLWVVLFCLFLPCFRAVLLFSPHFRVFLQVFSPEGKFLRSFDAASPRAIAVDAADQAFVCSSVGTCIEMYTTHAQTQGADAKPIAVVFTSQMQCTQFVAVCIDDEGRLLIAGNGGYVYVLVFDP